MEYAIGAFISIAIMVVLNRLMYAEAKKTVLVPMVYTQSRAYELTSAYSFISDTFSQIPIKLKTQATDYFDSVHKRVVLTDDKAYWIDKAGLVEADIVNGQIDASSQKGVDIMSASSVELNMIEIIVKALTEGDNNASGDSGN